MNDPSRGIELLLNGITHGGEAVGRLPDGKACFVPYAIPGERVRVEVVEDHPRWARARLLDVLEPSSDRVAPPCPYFGPGRCGGCQLQHIAADAQPALKRRIVREQLERVGKLVDPPVAETVVVRPWRYRSSARFVVDGDGRLGFRRAGSADPVAIDRCLLLDERTQALRDEAGNAWRGAREVAVRTSAAGHRALIVTPGSDGLPPLPPGDVPVALRAEDPHPAAALRGEPVLTEIVDGIALRVSPTSFFQSSREAATALSALVRRAARVRPGERVLDLYAGVGLFATQLAEDGAAVVAVEGAPVAADDARVNLAGYDAQVLAAPVDEAVGDLTAAGRRFDVVVLDPPRRGAGAGVSRALAALHPRVIVYVSCDPAALARDARALTDAGYPLAEAVPVDQFAQTAAIETVAAFRPADREME